jgi:hypothetical protein
MPSKRKPRPVKRANSVPVHRRVDVTRAEFNRIVELMNEHGVIVNDLRHTQDLQFKRIAQLQAELDALKKSAKA